MKAPSSPGVDPLSRPSIRHGPLSFLQGRAGLAILLLLSLATGVVLWLLSRESEQMYRVLAMQGTQLQSQTFTQLRQYYTTEVVARVTPHGIKALRDYRDHPDAIPLPITLTKELGERIHQDRQGAMVRVWSEYPFPGKDRSPPLDDFQQAALEALKANPSKPFHRFEKYEGRPSLRYAVADVLQTSCLQCHNDPKTGSPKTDWRAGEVRGVVEIIRPLDN